MTKKGRQKFSALKWKVILKFGPRKNLTATPPKLCAKSPPMRIPL